MFTDPLTRVGGEKCSYQVPTYEALKGIAKSVYWKPTLIWVIDGVRVMKRIRTQTKGTKPLCFDGGNSLAIYTFLTGDPDAITNVPGVEYQVRAHFEWNEHRPELAQDGWTANITRWRCAVWSVVAGRMYFWARAIARVMWSHAGLALAPETMTAKGNWDSA
jgi:CRISPR-associated protein Cas5 subtype I-C